MVHTPHVPCSNLYNTVVLEEGGRERQLTLGCYWRVVANSTFGDAC